MTPSVQAETGEPNQAREVLSAADVADSGTVQALTSLAMAPRQRLSGLPTSS